MSIVTSNSQCTSARIIFELVLEKAVHSKDTRVVKEIIEMLNQVASNMIREDCVECLNYFFKFSKEFKLYQNNYTLDEYLKILLSLMMI